jgi:hypothetical protein
MNAERVVATTTLSVGKEGGPIKASSKLETVPSSEPQKSGCSKQEEFQNYRNSGTPYGPLQPSAPQRGKFPSKQCILCCQTWSLTCRRNMYYV